MMWLDDDGDARASDDDEEAAEREIRRRRQRGGECSAAEAAATEAGDDTEISPSAERLGEPCEPREVTWGDLLCAHELAGAQMCGSQRPFAEADTTLTDQCVETAIGNCAEKARDAPWARVSKGRSRRRAQMLDCDGGTYASDADKDAAERREVARRPRYERDMRDVNMEEEAELRRLERRGAASDDGEAAV